MITNFGEGIFYLYRHINIITNEVFYIGIGTKWKEDLNKNYNYYYRRAFAKNGHTELWKNIIKSGYKVEIILETNNKNFLFEKEIEFIKLYGKLIDKTGSLTNLYDGGDTGYKFLSYEHKRKMSIAKKDKKQLVQHVLNRRNSLIEKYKVLQFDIKGNFIKEYPCPIDASKITGKSLTHILNSTSDKVKFTRDFIWFYKLGFSTKKLKDKILKCTINIENHKKVSNKIIIQKDLVGNILKEWESLTKIKEILKYNTNNILNAIKQKRIAKKSYWEFK